MNSIEFFFDCSSPWTYLAFSRIHSVAEEAEVEIIWKPVIVGGVFNEVNQEIYEIRKNPNKLKINYSRKDLQDWADLCGISIRWPSIFPVNAVKMMRAAIIANDQGKLVSYAWECFKSYWERDEDVSNDDILKKILISSGLSGEEILKSIKKQDIKDRLKNNTSELIKRGGFGSPTIFINKEDMFFGNDRIELIRYKLSKL